MFSKTSFGVISRIQRFDNGLASAADREFMHDHDYTSPMALSSRPEKFVLIVSILSALTAFGPLSIDMYLPAFPQIADDFGTSLSQVQLSLTTFFIGLAFGQLFYGPLMDRFGRKPPLAFGLTIYLISSLGCAIAPDIDTLILMRFFQALGSCAGMVGARAMVRDLFDERDSARVFSLLMLIMGIAPILAPLLGGYVSLQFGWHALFLIHAGLSSACIMAVIFLLPETRGANSNVRLSQSLSTYIRIFSNKKFIGFVLAGAFVQAGMFAYISGSPFVFIELFKIKPQHYGWYFGSNAFGLIFASQVNIRLLQKYRPEKILAKAFWILFTAGVALATSAYLQLSFYFLAIPIFIYISTLGITLPNTSAAAMAQERQRIGSASALLGTLQFALAAISSGIVSFLHNGTSLPMAGVIALCGAVSLAISLGIRIEKIPEK
jgi:MFS transporter, DHA1 family, multidrug resistance protein